MSLNKDSNKDETEKAMKGSNPKSQANLKPFSKGQSGNPAGRPPKLSNMIQSIPKDAQERIYAVLHHALAMPSEAAAKEYLDVAKDELQEYGFVLEIAVKSLTGQNGWAALTDILDRLFGKPRQSVENTISVEKWERPEIVIS